jgi:Gnt-I system high-affinity gluconate transporter
MSLLIIFVCIVLLILLITRFKVNAFLAFLLISIVAGIWLGMDITKLPASIQKGIGSLLGSLVVVIVSGAMLGKLVAESGAAQRITQGMMRLFGTRQIQWALMITGFIIGIPLFYNVGFVLVVPLIFSVAYSTGLPIVYVGVPMLASLSVTHGFLPPHPAPTALVGQFNADIGKTLLYGIIVAAPTVIIAGPLFSKMLRNINAKPPDTFKPASLPEGQLPGLGNSVISSLLPVLLLAVTTLAQPFLAGEASGTKMQVIKFVSDPDIVMLLSLAVATYTLGLRQGMTMTRIMTIYAEAVKDISMMLLIVGGAGALKQILVDSGVSNEIAALMQNMNVHPLVLAWLIAAIIRVCIGSATVAGLTAAGILAPSVSTYGVDPSLMVLSVGAGSLLFSHVNDAGFWLFKEYFNLSISDTIRSWSVMETIVAVVGLGGVLLLNLFV